MKEQFELLDYMTKGIEILIRDSIKAAWQNPKESTFLLKFLRETRKAAKLREKYERENCHMPPFLIASITSRCNLHCIGCYSRCNNATNDEKPVDQLNSAEWDDIFSQAAELGVSFIILAGGEPLMRKDVIQRAGEHKEILFPIFTNGTFFDDSYYKLFDENRNLFPVISIEGDEIVTNTRRGQGIYEKIMQSMNELSERKLLFGNSVTVNKRNLDMVLSEEFIDRVAEKGCKVIFYVEYVPMEHENDILALSEEERTVLDRKIMELRKKYENVIFLSFPGDEKESGGCLAAGRGFFHINSHGGAEPCPFSPYSDINVRDTSLKAAIQSDFFRELKKRDILNGEHTGGCILVEKRKQVEEILKM